jgi:4-hydroxy-tetrahydrodipicolinate reductase
MSDSAIRVLHYGLGPIGAEALRMVAERADLRVVGADDIDPAKVGRDAGMVTALGHVLGVTVTGDAEQALRETRPDVVVHCTGSFLAGVMPQLRDIIADGAAVISSCEKLSYPWRRLRRLSHGGDPRQRRTGGACRRARPAHHARPTSDPAAWERLGATL